MNMDLSKIQGKLLGHGSEKFCYLNKLDNSRCIKISNIVNCSQIKREINYFKFLERNKIHASFVPKFYGVIELRDYIGYEQECFLDKEHGGVYDLVWLLWDFIEDKNNDEDLILKELSRLKDEMLETNIICSDLHGGNIFRVVSKSIAKLVIVDGYGVPEFVPISKYYKYFGNKKIERQWDKFMRRLEISFNKRGRCS